MLVSRVPFNVTHLKAVKGDSAESSAENGRRLDDVIRFLHVSLTKCLDPCCHVWLSHGALPKSDLLFVSGPL